MFHLSMVVLLSTLCLSSLPCLFVFPAEALGRDPREVSVPVVGGHAGATILPLFSHAHPRGPTHALPAPVRAALVHRVQNAGTEVVEAKAGAGRLGLDG